MIHKTKEINQHFLTVPVNFLRNTKDYLYTGFNAESFDIEKEKKDLKFWWKLYMDNKIELVNNFLKE